MKPDVQTWVETAATRHVHDSVPIDQTHLFLVGRSLVQLLLYWRYKIPRAWGVQASNLDLSGVSLRIKEYVKLQQMDDYADTIYTALEKNNWQAIVDLPEPIWRLIRQITGLTISEWETIPVMVETLLSTQVVCPKCGLTSSYGQLGELKQISDPFAFFSSTSFHFNCSRCGSFLVVESYPTPKKKIKINWADVRAIASSILLLALGIQLFRQISGIFSQ